MRRNEQSSISSLSSLKELKEQAFVSNLSNFQVSIANSPEEKESARQLLIQEYIKKGYIADPKLNAKKNAYFDASSTIVLLGKKHDELLMTLSAIPDGEMGLPMDELFRKEIKPMREEGRRLVEVGSLASIDTNPRNVVYLQKYIICLLKNLDYHDILILLHPKHVNFYKHMYDAVAITKAKPYKAVNNNLAVVLRLKLK